MKTSRTSPQRPASTGNDQTARELGSSGAELLQRNRRTLRCAKRIQSQSNRRLLGLRQHLSAATTTSPSAAICANRSSTIYFQQDPRGSFTFTGAATGSDFADFLIGVPDASSIAFGNADKYFRQTVYDAYATDDWRVMPILTINAGMRWEYGAPMTEFKDRLVNLDVAPGFTQAAPVARLKSRRNR